MARLPEPRLDDGWTHVRRIRRGEIHTLPFNNGQNPPMKDMTEEKLRADFDVKMKVWQQSRCRKELVEILNKQRPDEGWHVENAICLATGSLSRENWQSRQRSMLQLVACVDVVRHLQSLQPDEKLHLYAQEPLYTPLDVAFLSKVGVMVLENPVESECRGLGAANDHLRSGSLVFEPFMDLGIDAMQELFRHDVRLYIGSSLERWVQREAVSVHIQQGLKMSPKATGGNINSRSVVDTTTRDNSLATRFCKSHRSYRFPRFDEDSNVFEGLFIYWKECEDDDAA